MQISLLGCNSLREQLLAAVSAELNCTNGPIKFIPTQAICKYEEPNSFADFFEFKIPEQIGLKENDFLGLLTCFLNEANWLSFDADRTISLFTVKTGSTL